MTARTHRRDFLRAIALGSGAALLAAFNAFLTSEQHAPRHRPSQLEPLFRG
jgi:hypothetical protein